MAPLYRGRFEAGLREVDLQAVNVGAEAARLHPSCAQSASPH